MPSKMRKIYLLPNVITAFGLSCGLFVIFKMSIVSPETLNQGFLITMAGIVLLASLADLLDGAIARAMKAESEFGGIFDSLSDAITFGVAPPLIILKSLSVTPETELSFFAMAGAMVFSVCGVLRLARYNVLQHQEKLEQHSLEQNHLDAKKKFFTGLPITAAAPAAVSMNLLLISDEFRSFFTISEKTRALILIFTMLLIGYFMVSRWKFPSLKSFHIRVASFRVVFLTVISAVFIFYGFLHHFAVVFFVFSWLYIVVSWILSLIRLIAGRKSKTLEDFEPEPEVDDLEEEL